MAISRVRRLKREGPAYRVNYRQRTKVSSSERETNTEAIQRTLLTRHQPNPRLISSCEALLVWIGHIRHRCQRIWMAFHCQSESLSVVHPKQSIARSCDFKLTAARIDADKSGPKSHLCRRTTNNSAPTTRSAARTRYRTSPTTRFAACGIS